MKDLIFPTQKSWENDVLLTIGRMTFLVLQLSLLWETTATLFLFFFSQMLLCSLRNDIFSFARIKKRCRRKKEIPTSAIRYTRSAKREILYFLSSVNNKNITKSMDYGVYYSFIEMCEFCDTFQLILTV